MARTAKRGTIPGQAKPADAATGNFWRKNDYFAEVFNKIVFQENPINPSDLEPYDSVEDALLRMMDGAHITLKQTRDVVKALKNDEATLVILGAENMMWIDYTMPFRVMALDFINMARQVSEIQNKNKENWKHCTRDYTKDEYLSRFYKKDKIKPVITLVIYYGQEQWDAGRRITDMLEESPYKKYAAEYPMHLFDVRHMTKEQLEEFSPILKGFLGYLMYENTEYLTEFVKENRDVFDDFPELAIDALIEITHSESLAKYKKDNRTAGGGINVMDGFQIYAEQYANQREKKTFVKAYQMLHQTLTDTIAAFTAKFQITDEEKAKEEVEKYWKE